ncbi:tubulin alpha 1 [Trebouxia sp. C0010 RCD-2024]
MQTQIGLRGVQPGQHPWRRPTALSSRTSVLQRSQCNRRCRQRTLSVTAAATSTKEPALGGNRTQTQGNNVVPATGITQNVSNRAPQSLQKPRIVILGSGWGAMSFIKGMSKKDSQKYDITLVSPRNYFLYTPLLPAVCTGTVEERSIVEPIRRIMAGKGKYFEAVASDIDPEKKSIVACFPADAGMDECCFKMEYDILVLGVGSVNNTFGIKGVQEHTFFFKSITDANKLRRQVSECFERAALPNTSDEEKKQLLSFLIVGGGPTGVEVAAELQDMVEADLVKVYPDLIKDVRIAVIELQDHVLSTYDRRISEYTRQIFTRNHIDLILNTKVKAVQRHSVTVSDASGVESEIPFGACVWATGVAMHPFIKQLQERLPAGSQTHFRSIITDEFLRVKGSGGSIYAIGDAATIEQPKALDYSDELFESADTNKDDKLTLAELRALMNQASKRYSHLEEHARFLDAKYGSKRFGGLVRSEINSQAASPLNELSDDTEITRTQFEELLAKIDKGLRALPATAQVARQEGEYLARLLKQHNPEPHRQGKQALLQPQKPFKYTHLGSLAYVGADKAVMDIPKMGPVTGWTAGLLWRGFETYSQISFRNQSLVAVDWVRTKIFGRDISRV